MSARFNGFRHCYRSAFVFLRINSPHCARELAPCGARGAAAAAAASIFIFYATLVSFLHLYQKYVHKLDDQALDLCNFRPRQRSTAPLAPHGASSRAQCGVQVKKNKVALR
jgi:hypothetical protein